MLFSIHYTPLYIQSVYSTLTNVTRVICATADRQHMTNRKLICSGKKNNVTFAHQKPNHIIMAIILLRHHQIIIINKQRLVGRPKWKGNGPLPNRFQQLVFSSLNHKKNKNKNVIFINCLNP